MNKRKDLAKTRIPEFATYEEEARFWDTHDTTDFEDEFKPVRVHVAKKLSSGLTIRLDRETLEKLRRAAQVTQTAYPRQWMSRPRTSMP